MDDPPLTPELAEAAVANGIRRYFAARRERVGPFVDAHYSLRGTLALHRAALGWDIARAPVNLALALPQIALKLGAWTAGRLGARRFATVLGRPILLRTAVSREIEWLMQAELLELPVEQPGRASRRDALAEAILAEPGVSAAMDAALRRVGPHSADPAFRERLRRAIGEYGVSRAAAAEITTGLASLGAGAAVANKLTPGMASLGPTVAAMVAQQAAVASFPLGGWAGGLWYGLFPAVPSLALDATATGGMMLAATVFAAFAGIVSDPVQRAAGLHRARLLRMVNALERQWSDPAAAGFVVHDHYVARLLDLFGIVRAALRLARG